jgi:hypothetical protein
MEPDLVEKVLRRLIEGLLILAEMELALVRVEELLFVGVVE